MREVHPVYSTCKLDPLSLNVAVTPNISVSIDSTAASRGENVTFECVVFSDRNPLSGKTHLLMCLPVKAQHVNIFLFRRHY